MIVCRNPGCGRELVWRDNEINRAKRRQYCDRTCANRDPDRIRTRSVSIPARKAQNQQAADDRAEDIRYLLDAGESVTQIAFRFGIKPTSIARQMHRRGHHDLGVIFDRKKDHMLRTAA